MPQIAADSGMTVDGREFGGLTRLRTSTSHIRFEKMLVDLRRSHCRVNQGYDRELRMEDRGLRHPVLAGAAPHGAPDTAPAWGLRYLQHRPSGHVVPYAVRNTLSRTLRALHYVAQSATIVPCQHTCGQGAIPGRFARDRHAALYVRPSVAGTRMVKYI